jgi:MYXO-CTERM domain-containing protein
MAFYTQESDGALSLVNQCNVGSTDGPLNTISMIATVTDPTVPAKLALQVGGFSGDYWIIEVGTNYEYAVVGHPTRAYLWILSRTPVLDSTTLEGIVSRAQTNQFDTSTLQYTPQVTAGARVSSGAPLGTVPPAVTTGCTMSHAPGGGKESSWCFGLAVSGLLALWARRRRSS